MIIQRNLFIIACTIGTFVTGISVGRWLPLSLSAAAVKTRPVIDAGDAGQAQSTAEVAAPAIASMGVVKMSVEEFEAMGGKIRKAGPENLEQTKVLYGEVRMPDDKVARIYPRFSGVTTELKVKIGDRVKKGQTLAVIESNDSLASFNMASPIAGEVIERNLSLGEIARDAEVAFVIANTNSIMLEMSAFEQDLPVLERGQTVTVRLPSGETLSSTISYISNVLSRETRSALVRAEFANAAGKLRPGSITQAVVTVASEQLPLAVSMDGLHTIEGKNIVFVATEEGFNAQVVKISRTDEKYAQIVEGLDPGSVYADKGSLILRSEMTKTDDDD